jgi:hypothetical protein
MDIKAELEIEWKKSLAEINNEPEKEPEKEPEREPESQENSSINVDHESVGIADAEWEELLRNIKQEPVEKTLFDGMQQVVVVIKREYIPSGSLNFLVLI